MSNKTTPTIKPDLVKATPVPSARWKAAPVIEDDALTIMKKVFPLQWRARATDAVLEQFYDKGLLLYKSGKYKDALPYFNLLTAANIKEARYSFAKAATYHMLKEYLVAGQSYSICSMIDPENPIPQYHLADCCLHMNNFIGAFIALEMALARCKKNPEYQSLQDRVQVMLNGLKKEFEEKKKLEEKFFYDDGTHHRIH